MIPLITRRSSTRGTPVGLLGSSGSSLAHCLSFSQNSPDIIPSITVEMNHIQEAGGIPFMGPSPSIVQALAAQLNASVEIIPEKAPAPRFPSSK
jgi:hypothetical protein